MTWFMSPEDQERYAAMNRERENAPVVVPEPMDLEPDALAEALARPGPLLLVDSEAMREALEEASAPRGFTKVGTSSAVALHVHVKAAMEGRENVLVDW